MSDLLKVLLVEDCEEDAQQILLQLRRGGFEPVLSWVNSSEALQIALAHQSWDVIIYDYEIPDLDEFTALQMTKQYTLDTPFLVISGSAEVTNAVRLLKAGAADYILKTNLSCLSELVHNQIQETNKRNQKRQELISLRNTKERLQFAIDASDVGVWDWSIQTGQVVINRRWAEIIGYSVSELEPATVQLCSKFTHPEDVAIANRARERHFSGEAAIYQCEIRKHHASGQWIWVLDRGKIVEWDSSGKPLRMTGTHLDITERKYAEILWQKHLEDKYELKQAETRMNELEQINRLKDDFLSTVSHELRTPLTNIRVALTLLKHASSSDKRSKYIQILEEQCSREIELIDDLLNLQRFESNTLSLELSVIHLREWLQLIVEPFLARMDQHSQHLKIGFELENDLLYTDASKLTRILSELLNNACKYTPKQGFIQIQVSNFNDNNMEFQVSNTCANITVEDLAHIFDKFYRIPQNDPWKHGGTGLGLALIKKLVEQLNGTIQVDMEEQTTLSFKILIPQQPEESI